MSTAWTAGTNRLALREQTRSCYYCALLLHAAAHCVFHEITILVRFGRSYIVRLLNGNNVPGVELCVRSPDRHCLVVGIATIALRGGEFWHVARHSKLVSGVPSERGPMVAGTRPRWAGMLAWLL